MSMFIISFDSIHATVFTARMVFDWYVVVLGVLLDVVVVDSPVVQEVVEIFWGSGFSGFVVDPFSVLEGASVVDEDPVAGVGGGVVGVGGVDLDVVDCLGLSGRGGRVEGDGLAVLAAEPVPGLEVSGRGEALVLDVEGVGAGGRDGPGVRVESQVP